MEEVELMYVACAACKEILDTKLGPIGEISHTICEPCVEKLYPEFRGKIKKEE